MENGKLKILHWFDILILTIIMFGEGIYNSTIHYIALSNNVVSLSDNLSFSSIQNYRALAMQSFWLFLAIMYLLYRNFDFSVFYKKIKFTPWLPVQAIGIFVISALFMDMYYLLSYNVVALSKPSMYQLFQNVDLSLILYSLFNGFYEEIFFLGACLCVKEQYIKYAFFYSLIIRCSFHTYQGLGTAIALGLLLGSVFYILYRKLKPENLLPFFLSHSIADIMGLSIIFYFWK